ncbi:MAG: DUF6398 domain-containing protein [Nanoarchaeota archaeon]
MPNVFTGKVAIPGDKIDKYLKIMEQAEKDREPFVNSLNKLNEEFGDYLDEKSLSGRTISKHCGIIDLFIDFLARYTDIEKIDDVTKGMANTHFKNWYRRKVWDSTTPDEITTAIKKFFTFLAENKGIVNEKVLANPKAKSTEKNLGQKDNIIQIIDKLSDTLNFTVEDRKTIRVMIDAYFRKRKSITKSNDDITAAAFLWQYSKINFLWEHDKSLMKKNIAELLNVSPSTVGNKSSEISKALNIDFFDERFCRKEVSDENPFKQFAITQQGFIVKNNLINEKNIPSKKDKEDYFYDGTDFLQAGNKKEAIACFNKALEIDENYVDAHNGLGNIYFNDDLEKSKQYYQKAYELTKKHFNNQWPIAIEWGVIENRQYLRAMHGLGLIFWRENNLQEAKRLFMLMLRLNNNDNQGARYLVAAILEGMTWDQYGKIEDKAMESSSYSGEEKLFEKQNKIHNFYKYQGDV